MSANGEFSFTKDDEATSPVAGSGGAGRPAGRPSLGVVVTKKSLPKIQTHAKKEDDGICHDDSTTPVKAQTIDELHLLQKKKSAPTTPIKSAQSGPFAPPISEEDRHKQQLQSISASLASLTRETGPRLVKGDPDRKAAETPRVASHSHDYFVPSISISDSALKFTHVLYNLSPAGNALR